MKITDEYLKIQAYLDGELTAGEAREVQSRIEAEPLLGELHKELKSVSEMFVPENEIAREVPLPRNAYWAGIRDAIDAQSAPAAVLQPSGWKLLFLRLRIPAFGAVALLALGLFLVREPGVPASVEASPSFVGYVDHVDLDQDVSTMSYYAEEQEMSVTFISCDKAYTP